MCRRRSAYFAATLLAFACALSAVSSAGASTLEDRHKAWSLHVDGRRLVTANGRTVQLHGVNLGGWLVTEAWMCGFSDGADDKAVSGSAGVAGRHTQESLAGRFGPDKAALLMEAWRDSWVTARDLDQVQSAGFNLVRVPFSYRTLQHEDGSWIRDRDGKIDFSRMDWVVGQAAQRGLYTIFDLHVWPEQRFASDKIGRPEGGNIRRSMSRLWTTIAAHYREEGAIAGFDLINEFPGAWGVQQVFSDAVKKSDPERIQVIEGFTPAEFNELQQHGAFQKAIYSEHLYGTSSPLTTEEIAARLQSESGVSAPVYIGEFLAQDFQAATSAMNDSGISWSSWTYKTVDMGNWGVFNYSASLRTDIQKDSFEAILDRWTMDLTRWQASGSSDASYVNEDRRPVGAWSGGRPCSEPAVKTDADRGASEPRAVGVPGREVCNPTV